ncbi:hypothetical protein [Phytohabitans kaempferiae]|uniref:Uncharacterized protein n=1 Tax=Phytohabitans kaempferiae TaxID=1620943 RepID=A0ABV6M2R4_9ACTN
MIAVPLGPEGGAGQHPSVEGVIGPETVADLKGRTLLVDTFTEHFDAPVAVA